MCICIQLLWLERIGSMQTMMKNWCNIFFLLHFLRLCYCFPFFTVVKIIVFVPFPIFVCTKIEISYKMQVYSIPSFSVVAAVTASFFFYLQHLWQNAYGFGVVVFIGITFHLKTSIIRSKRVCAPNIIYSQQYNRAIAIFFFFWWCCSVSLLFCWTQTIYMQHTNIDLSRFWEIEFHWTASCVYITMRAYRTINIPVDLFLGYVNFVVVS